MTLEGTPLEGTPLDPARPCGRLEFAAVSVLLSLPGLAAEAMDAAALFRMDLEDLIARPDFAAGSPAPGPASVAVSCATWVAYALAVARRLTDLGQPRALALACLAPPVLAVAGMASDAASAAGSAVSLGLGAWSLYLATAAGNRSGKRALKG